MGKKLLFISIILGLSACKNYLDTKPKSFVTPNTYYRNENELTAALMAVYSELGNTDESTYSRFLALEAPAANDENLRRGPNTAISADIYNTSASYENFFNCWTALYSGIQKANLLLENIDKASAPQTVKDKIKGEALFLRAYYHFVLVSYWGDIPLKLKSTSSVSSVNIRRTPSAQVYGAIINDMTLAHTLVSDISEIGNPGRISKTAVAGILARVCLSAAGRLKDSTFYAEAAAWAQRVIASGLHRLNPDYQQIFINQTINVYDTAESLWEVEFFQDNSSSLREYERFGSTIGIRNTDDKTGFSQGAYTATAVLFDLYLAGDKRRDWNIAPFYYLDNDRKNAVVDYLPSYKWGRYVAKWRREYQTTDYNKNFGGTNWPLLRYADVLLMYAEAENEIHGAPTPAAYDAVNQVRRRAYGFPIHTPSSVADLPTGLTKNQFFLWLKDERSRELAFEGLRKLDLLRWGLLTSTMQQMLTSINATAPILSKTALGYNGKEATLKPYQNFTSRDLFFPIPTQELSLNTLITQTNGW
ncbi:MAG TPA: RagB/SusD family nutrient uptake outer membrane protein [Pelobium sp.]